MPRTQRIDIGAPADSPAVMAAAGLVPPVTTAAQSYMDILAANGVTYDPEWGVLVHRAPAGSRDGKPVRRKYPVALTAEEAREKTRAGVLRSRWDYFATGVKCGDCAAPISGWAWGGRKFNAEHDHVTDASPDLYEVVELDEDGVTEDDPVAVGA